MSKLNKLSVSSAPITASSRIVSLAAGLTVATVATLIALHKALPYFHTHYLGGAHGDTALYLWLTREIPNSLRLDSWFTTRGFYPYQYSLAWSDNFLLPSLMVQALLALGSSHIVAWNLLIFITIALNGLTVFYCAKRLNLPLPSALLACGSTAMLLPILVNLGHPQLIFIFWVPLALTLTISHLQSPQAINGLLASMILLGTFLTTVYYAVFLGLIIGFIALCFVRVTRLKIHLQALLLGALLTILALPLFLPYTEVRSTLGPRDSSEALYFAANILSFGATSSWSRWYRENAALSHEEAFLFPGVALLLTGLVSTYLLLRSRISRAGLLALVMLLIALLLANFSGRPYRLGASLAAWFAILLVSYFIRSDTREASAKHLELVPVSVFFLGIILSLGPLGNHVIGEAVISPHGILFQLIPGLDGIRAISRAGLLAVSMLPLLAASGLSRIRTLPAQWLCAAGLFMAISIESQLHSIPLEPPTNPPPIFAKLKDLPDTSPLIALPMAVDTKNDGTILSWRSYAMYTTDLMIWLADQPRHYINGYSGIRSWIMTTYPRWLSSFPSETSLNAIARLVGVETILYLGSKDPRYDREHFHNTLEALTSRITILAQDGDDYILRLSPWQPLDASHPARLITGPSSAKVELEIDATYCFEEGQRDAIAITVSNRGQVIERISVLPGTPTNYELSNRPEYVEQGLIMLDFNSSSECMLRIRGIRSLEK